MHPEIKLAIGENGVVAPDDLAATVTETDAAQLVLDFDVTITVPSNSQGTRVEVQLRHTDFTTSNLTGAAFIGNENSAIARC